MPRGLGVTRYPSDAPAHPDSDRPTVVAVSGVAHVAIAAEELPVSSGRVRHSVAEDALEHRAHDIEEPARSCALSGRVLEPGALCDIVSFVAQAVWRGELVVASGDATRSVFFDEGSVVAAESSAPSERLGEVLRRRGMLTDAQVRAAAELTETGAHRFGEAAVALGFITREGLFDAMALQIEEIFSAVLRVERGSFTFFHGYEEARLSFRRRHEVEALLVTAIAGMDDARYFRSRIPSDSYVPMRTAGRTDPAGDPLGVYAAIDGARSVAELAAAIDSSPLEVTRALFQHVQTGHASVKAPRLSAKEVVAVYNRAILVLLRELDAMDEGDGVRAELAAFAERGAERPSFVDVPADDGTLDAETIAARIEALDDPAAGTERLARWLYDYASYALFLARPHLHRRDEGRIQPRVSQRVAEMLDAIAPAADVTVPPAQAGVRVTIPVRADSTAPGSDGHTLTSRPRPPPLASTVRMRRVLPEAIPGLDPSRTVRMAPFAMAVAPEPASTRAVRAAEVGTELPEQAKSVRRADVAAAANVTPRGRAARLHSPLFVLGVLAAGALGWTAHRAADVPAPSGDAPAAVTSSVTSAAGSETAAPAPSPSAVTELVVVCEPRCGAVYVDGKESTSSGDAIAVTAGAHDVAVRRPGHASEYRRVVVAEGESRAVTFQLTAVGQGRAK